MRNIFITSVKQCLAWFFFLFTALVSLSVISNVSLLVSNASASQKSESHDLQPGDNRNFDSDVKVRRLPKLKPTTTAGTHGGFVTNLSKLDCKLSISANPSTQFSVIEHLMSYLSYDEIKSQYSNCATPPEKTTFFDTDYFVTLWFSFQNATKGDTFQVKWYAPDGTLFGKGCTTFRARKKGIYCYMPEMYIKEYSTASKLGNWQVKVYRNDSLLFTEDFSIQKDTSSDTPTSLPTPVFSVVEHLMTSLSYNELKKRNSFCGTPPKETTFLDTDLYATLWFTIQNATEGDTFKTKWYEPDGTLYGTTQYTHQYDYRYSYYALAAWIYIKGYRPASIHGNWHINVYRNSTFLFTENFEIQ